ncbi:hypothetical protein J2S34_002212 [Nitrobacter winogradskyi]|uniref:Uncharacterized protein n=1 Tax=Nitrobacter winogradskyi TaxID=913 RepID=A0ACC6AK57_NITWI|nr:hypothetical protein [Nitrobacter winogradskyi]
MPLFYFNARTGDPLLADNEGEQLRTENLPEALQSPPHGRLCSRP